MFGPLPAGRVYCAPALLSVAVEWGAGDFMRLTMIESPGELMGRADLGGDGGGGQPAVGAVPAAALGAETTPAGATWAARDWGLHGGQAVSLLLFSAWKFVLTAAMMAAPIPIGVLVRGPGSARVRLARMQ